MKDLERPALPQRVAREPAPLLDALRLAGHVERGARIEHDRLSRMPRQLAGEDLP